MGLTTPLLDTTLTLYEVDVALNTVITLGCSPGAVDAVCTVTRFNDLHRILDIPPTEVPSWFLTFEGGFLRSWAENRGFAPGAYASDAVFPFLDWVVANTELDDRQFEQLYFSGGTQDWVPREGIANDLVGLVAQWAANLGVTLEEP